MSNFPGEIRPTLDSPVYTCAPSRPNGDEGLDSDHPYIGNFHKTLQHNKFGEVIPQDYQAFVAACSGTASFEAVPMGAMANHAFNRPPPPSDVDRFVSPQAGFATESLGPDPSMVELDPAPRVRSLSTAAEMTELYWMVIHRDVPFYILEQPGQTTTAINDLRNAFTAAIADSSDPGRLRLGVDLPTAGGNLDLRPETLYRSGLPDEDKGPLVSQFFLHDVPFGTQLIEQKQFPYRRKADYLIDHTSFLRTQDTGYDVERDPYPDSNDERDNPNVLEGGRVRFRNMRDLARFVHRDALHQAYFNAALLLLNWKAEPDPGNPYLTFKRQRDFATLGGPHLLALVSEVASRALKVVWRQKWAVHRRLRPEAYGGLLQMQVEGLEGDRRAYGLPDIVHQTAAAGVIRQFWGGYYLPMAFTSGAPVHPAYGAGHATVAGACVTILKAWFKEDEKLRDVLARSSPAHPVSKCPVHLVGTNELGADCLPELPPHIATQLTVEGELNKLASNVAMGRSMGGVHWRSDNTRSLRLGETIATVILKRIVNDYKEKSAANTPLSWSYRSFDGHLVKITPQGVTVNNVPSNFYATF